MNRRYSNAEQKERIRQRVRVQIDEENYQFFPERKDPDYYDNDVNQRVGVYVRVSTDDPRQTTSYELQKKYYEDFVVRHPKWTLVDIYADEGISGTSTKHRDEFNRMIAECKAGKIDLVITKSVSRFARNVVDFLGMVRMLSERNPPIGVFFEAENIFSLNETSNMALSFQATMAEEGMLKGFVIINPRWSGFKEQEYLRASASAYPPGEYDQQSDGLSFEVEAGDFDMRGFEIAHTDLFDVQQTPHVTFFDDTIKFSTECIRRMKAEFHVELLIHPTKRKFAVRAADKQNKNAVIWAKMRDGRKESRSIACAAYADTIYSLFGWKREHKYRMFSTLLSNGEEEVFIFSADEAAAYIQSEKIPNHDASEAFIEPVTKSGDHVMGIPACYTDSFGNDYYIEQTYSALANQTREQWQIRVEGQLCNTGMQLNVTDYDTLRNFIMDELGDWKPQEDERNEQQ